MKTYSVTHYRGPQAEGAKDKSKASNLSVSQAYRAAVDAQTTPGCRLISITRDSDGSRVSVRQVRQWGKIK